MSRAAHLGGVDSGPPHKEADLQLDDAKARAGKITQALETASATTDPLSRAKLATQQLSEAQALVQELSRIRRDAIGELRELGLTMSQIAETLGVSRGRIGQLGSAGPSVEQAFFGGASLVTIATHLRRTEEGRPMVVQEAATAAMILSQALAAAGLETRNAHVGPAPQGLVDWSPVGLVVICGPQRSQDIAAAIAADPTYDYSPTGEPTVYPGQTVRWRITDRRTGEAFGSPLDDDMDAGACLAYIARLPRPKDARPAVIIAGLHALGSLGGAAYLADPDNVRSLQDQVGDAPFSALVASEHQRATIEITGARIVSGPNALPA